MYFRYCRKEKVDIGFMWEVKRHLTMVEKVRI